ncbi:MAG: hypothetical protein ACI4WV_00760 [Eubacteriales bacterium]
MKHSLNLPITEDKKVHTWLYRLSLFTWLANIALIVINLFVDLFGISIICLFVSVVLQGFLSGVFATNSMTLEEPVPKTRLDLAVSISQIISLLVSAVGFISILLAGGSPEIVNEAYCLVNHGEVVRTVSKNWFVYLSVCEYCLQFFSILIFSTFMFSKIRGLYLTQTTAQGT